MTVLMDVFYLLQYRRESLHMLDFLVTLESLSGVTRCVRHCIDAFSTSRYRSEENNECCSVGEVKVERAAQSHTLKPKTKSAVRQRAAR